MAIEVVVPKMGMTMKEGTVVEWLVDPGTAVEAGTPLFVIETDKLLVDYEAEASGIFQPVAPLGEVLGVGVTIGWLLEEGEPLPIAGAPTKRNDERTARIDEPGADVSQQVSAYTTIVKASPKAKAEARRLGIALEGLSGTGPGGRILSADVWDAADGGSAAVTMAPPPVSQGVNSSPLARRLARALRLDLTRSAGSSGSFTMGDIEAALAEIIDTENESADPVSSVLATDPPQVFEVTAMRRTISERMTASLRDAAQLTMTMDTPADELLRLRSALQAVWAPEGRSVPTITHIIAFAAARCLLSHPTLNSRLDETADRLVVPSTVNMGIAVALEKGLIVPVVNQADQISLESFAREAHRLSTAARDGTLQPDEAADSTFTVTSLGSYGVDSFTPILDPPNAGILGIGAISDGIRIEDGSVVPIKTLTLSLTIDHRIVDGAPGALFLADVRDSIGRAFELLGPA